MASAIQLAAPSLYELWRKVSELRPGADPVDVYHRIDRIYLTRQDYSAREIAGAEGSFFEGRTRFVGRKSYRTRIPPAPDAPPAGAAPGKETGSAETGDLVTGGRGQPRGEALRIHGGGVRLGDQFRRDGPSGAEVWYVEQVRQLYGNPAQGVLQGALQYLCRQDT